MEPKFWHERWEQNIIGFHNLEPNPRLVEFLPLLNMTLKGRILVPLCGKSVDMPWIASKGHHVVGVELSQIAVDQFFEELKIKPEIVRVAPKVLKYSVDAIDIFVANFFHVTIEIIGKIDAIYDRAAIVALPENMRKDYSSHLVTISKAAKQLLITYEYDQTQMDGPPFSVPGDELQRLYSEQYQLQQISRSQVGGGLKGTTEASEVVWILKNSSSA